MPNDIDFEVSSPLKTLWVYMDSQYDFLRDEIKQRVLYKNKNASDKDWKEFDITMLSTISKNAMFAGLKTASEQNIKKLLNSDEVESFNAIENYFDGLKGKNPISAIKRFAACIKTQNDAAFEKYLRKWLVASVANVYIKEKCTNHTCIVLTGGQGKGKSRCISYLIPDSLRDYFNEDGFDLQNVKDTKIKLADYWIIHLEETLGSLNRKDDNVVKQLITTNSIKVRRPFAPMDSMAYRLANIIASTNEDDFLTDHTGNRRYLSFKCLDIDDKAYKKINIDDVWAEAYNLFTKGFEYWTTQEDMKELSIINNEFAFVSIEEQYLIQNFSKPGTDCNYCYFLQSSTIVDYLTEVTKNKTINPIRVGKALKKLGFEQITHRYQFQDFPTKCWKVKLTKTTNFIEMLKTYEASETNNFKP